jgi:hypothetical protein
MAIASHKLISGLALSSRFLKDGATTRQVGLPQQFVDLFVDICSHSMVTAAPQAGSQQQAPQGRRRNMTGVQHSLQI